MPWPLEVPSKDLPESSDVVVIGSGFTGLSAARSLAKAGMHIVVLEAEEIGAGASSRNGGIVHPTLGVSAQELISRYGKKRAKDLYNLIFDQLPHLGQMEGIHYALGFNGDGVLLGCYLGSKIADMVRGEGEPTPLTEIPFPAMAFYRRRTWFMPFARAFYGFLDAVGL